MVAEGLLPQTNVKDKQIQQARNDIRFAGQLRRSSRPDSSKPRPRRVRSHDRHRCPHLHSRGAGHERIRTLRRCHLPHLLHLRTRPRRALGEVPVARPGAEGAQRDRVVVAAARRVHTRSSLAVASIFGSHGADALIVTK